MHARANIIEGDPSHVDEGIAFVRDVVQPRLMELEGCLGVSMLVDRDTGHAIVTSSWESAEAMAASDAAMAASRAEGGRIMGSTPQVHEWEVAVMHRGDTPEHGACCRVTWMRLHQGEVDRAIRVYRSGLLPEIEQLDGFCSASLLVDRASGRACSSVAFATVDTMESSRDRAWTIRETGAREAGVDVMDVEEFELALAHLRLPELV